MPGRELYAAGRAGQRRTWTVAALLLAIVFITLGQVATILPAAAAGWIDPTDQSDWKSLSFILFAAFGVAAALTLAWVVWFERRTLAHVGLNGGVAARFGRGFAMGLVYLGVTVGAIWGLGAYQVEASGITAGAVGPAVLVPLVVLLLGFIVQGSTEEIIFRGWLMGLIASRHGLVLAVIVNSLLFGLVHAGNIAPSRELVLSLVNIALFGVFISLYAAREGSIWGVCGWHAAWNWFLGTGFGLEVSGAPIAVTPLVVDLRATDAAEWWLTGGAFGPEGSVVTTAVLLISTVALMVRGGLANHAAASAPVVEAA